MTRYRPTDDIDHPVGGMRMPLKVFAVTCSSPGHTVHAPPNRPILTQTGERPHSPGTTQAVAGSATAIGPPRLAGTALPAAVTARRTFNGTSNANPSTKNTTSEKIATR